MTDLRSYFTQALKKGWNDPQLRELIPQNISDPFLPLAENVFRAFEVIAPEDVQYVILGQDPYYTTWPDGSPVATGLAFVATAKNHLWRRPLSLRRIEDHANLESGMLAQWAADKRILLLNAALTVPRKTRPTPGEHLSNWHGFTSHIISNLARSRHGQWCICWGKEARKIAQQTGLSDEQIVYSHHPAARTKADNPQSFDAFWKTDLGQRLKNDAS